MTTIRDMNKTLALFNVLNKVVSTYYEVEQIEIIDNKIVVYIKDDATMKGDDAIDTVSNK